MLNRLLKLLSDGKFYSGEWLGEQLGISRAAVWKHLKKLEELDIPYSSVKGRGYRLVEPVELFEAALIKEQLSHSLDHLEILPNIDSTNTYLFKKASDYVGQRYAVLAEQQTAGKGRRGRHWISPFGKNIYLSLLVTMQGGIASLEGLSLIIAIAVERALVKAGVKEVGLKWPNDIYLAGNKLAGILLEVTGEYNSHCQVVIGVGINMSLTEQEAEDISQPWAQLLKLYPQLSRNALAGAVLNELLWAIDEFQQNGFHAYQQYWSARDVFQGQPVRILSASNERVGVVKGVNRKGELMLMTDQGLVSINAGEVSVRPTH